MDLSILRGWCLGFRRFFVGEAETLLFLCQKQMDSPAYRFSLCDVVLFTIDFQTLLCSFIQSDAEAGLFGIF